MWIGMSIAAVGMMMRPSNKKQPVSRTQPRHSKRKILCLTSALKPICCAFVFIEECQVTALFDGDF